MGWTVGINGGLPLAGPPARRDAKNVTLVLGTGAGGAECYFGVPALATVAKAVGYYLPAYDTPQKRATLPVVRDPAGAVWVWPVNEWGG
jgi:hypothetical protein